MPWYPAAKVDGFDIVPIDNSVDLRNEGLLMHHCIGGYVGRVMEGELYAYSVSNNDQKVATFALRRDSTAAVQLLQLRGPYNCRPAGGVTPAVRRWLREKRKEARQ
jgi:hypothetical protein